MEGIVSYLLDWFQFHIPHKSKCLTFLVSLQQIDTEGNRHCHQEERETDIATRKRGKQKKISSYASYVFNISKGNTTPYPWASGIHSDVPSILPHLSVLTTLAIICFIIISLLLNYIISHKKAATCITMYDATLPFRKDTWIYHWYFVRMGSISYFYNAFTPSTSWNNAVLK